jgi:hypothetical protein
MKNGFWFGLIMMVAALRPAPGAAQGFPWNDFERRTLPELVKINEREESENIQRTPDETQFVFRDSRLPSVVTVNYTGESRPLSAERKKFIQKYALSYFRNSGYANLYVAEYLFKAGAEDYWLPVQQDVAKYFPEDLKKGEVVDLYLIAPGGLRSNKDKTVWLFLVEQYQQPLK